MAHFLRSRLTCFYCGRGLSQKKTPDLRKFDCEHCDAENYLDENGEITDPPPPESSSARYASSLQRPESPIFDIAPDDIFCGTCLKNQHLLTESLAQYYPSPNDPHFHEYDLAFPEYKRSLEERYPQVCSNCEPRARKRLGQTYYAAKTDNMRRVMDRLNPERRHLNEPGQWKLWIPFLGGFMWALSWAGQIAWDVMGSLTIHAGFKIGPQVQSTMQGALKQLFVDRQVSPILDELFLPYASYALLLGLLSAWWNPRLKEKFNKKGGRMVGLTEYYKLQAIFLGVRGFMWYWVTYRRFDVNTEQAAHVFLLILSVVAIIVSHNTIVMDYTPKVLFKESPKSLLSQPPGQSPNIDESPSRRTKIINRSALFPIESLAQKPPPSYAGPTLAQLEQEARINQIEEEAASDSMDWTPSTPSIRLSAPRPYTASSNSRNASPSRDQPRAGFKGRLPPNIHSPAARLRNPLKPEFRAANPAKTSRFFSQGQKQPTDTNDGSDENDNGPLSPANSILANLSPMKIAPPRFFPPGGEGDETGLERMFEQVFTVGSAPAEVRELQTRRVELREQQREQEGSWGFKVLGLGAVVVVWAGLIRWVEWVKAGG